MTTHFEFSFFNLDVSNVYKGRPVWSWRPQASGSIVRLSPASAVEGAASPEDA